MSEMLPDENRVLAADSRQEDGDSNDSANWLNRWVDIAQIGGGPVTGTNPELAATLPAVESPMSTPRIVILVCFGFLIIISIVELGFGNPIRE